MSIAGEKCWACTEAITELTTRLMRSSPQGPLLSSSDFRQTKRGMATPQTRRKRPTTKIHQQASSARCHCYTRSHTIIHIAGWTPTNCNVVSVQPMNRAIRIQCSSRRCPQGGSDDDSTVARPGRPLGFHPKSWVRGCAGRELHGAPPRR